MEVQEISNRLDYRLQKFSTGLSVTEYAKSLYLTKAQNEFIRQVSKAYEYGDELRHLLGPLLITENPSAVNTIGAFKGVVFTPTLDTVIKIVYERVGGDIPVIPLDTNDVHFTLRNPFREPNSEIAYRVNHDGVIEVISKGALKNYSYIYIKEPSPIILEDLPLNLVIGGLNTETTSVLADSSVLQIIEMAAVKIIKEAKDLAPQKPQPPQQK